MMVLVVGAGRVGAAVAKSALAAGHTVSVLDEDPLSHERLDAGQNTSWEDAGGRFTVDPSLARSALGRARERFVFRFGYRGRSATLLIRALDERPPFTEQDEAGVTYAEKIGPEDRTLDLARPAIENERVVRALHPHIGARIALAGGSFLGVRAARAREDGSLELIEVQPAGGRPMAYADYVRGHGPVPGAA